MSSLKSLSIGDLTVRLPIIQGGMGVGVSLAGLASAVANEGCLGVISAAGIGMYEPDYSSNYPEANIRALKKEIQKLKQLTNGVVGINIMVAMTNFADMVKTSISEGIDIIFSGAGLPLNLPEYLTAGAKTKLAPIVSSVRAAKLIINRWESKYNYIPDMVVVEGPKAGGHLGFSLEQIDDNDYSLENIIPPIIEEVRSVEKRTGKQIPVIAAGGIYTGEDIYKILSLGISGIQMGTRFVTTEECDASAKFKQSYIDSSEEDIVIIKSPVGMPGRAIRSKFLDDVSEGRKKPILCNYHCVKTCNIETAPYCIVSALINAKKGNFTNGFAFAGENAYRADKLLTVHELISILVQEYDEYSNSLVNKTSQVND
jgi:nitronate monooxygenase